MSDSPGSSALPTPLVVRGLINCVQEALQTAHRLMAQEFGATYRGSLQGSTARRYVAKFLVRDAAKYPWTVVQRDYYGNDADPDSMTASYPMVRLDDGVAVVILNATHVRVPNSHLMGTGLTRWEGSPQGTLFDTAEMGGPLGWAIPADVRVVYFLRYAVDTSTPERNSAFAFDLVELEAGGLGVRRYAIRDLAAYAAAAEPVEPEPEAVGLPSVDLSDMRPGPFEDVVDEEPEVGLRDDAFDDEQMN